MNVYVYISPDYRDNLWCAQALHGINEEAAKKRYSVKMLETDDIFDADLDTFFGEDAKRLLLILSSSITEATRLNEFFSTNGIHTLYVNHQSLNNFYSFSNIVVDYYDATRYIADYLETCGRKSIALYGINLNSSTDFLKKTFFEDRRRSIPPYGNGENIYYNRSTGDTASSLTDCFRQFERNIGYYDAVICANDIVAYSLIGNLAAKGIRVPEDIYITSFGDSILSQIGKPTLTTVSVNHSDIGKQAIYAYSYLYKASSSISMTSKITPQLFIRESTAGQVCRVKKRPLLDTNDYTDARFFADPEVDSLIRFENMLTKCDKLDLQILMGIPSQMTYIQLAEQLFVSENVISYRVKRLCKLAGLSSKAKLSEAINRHLSKEAMENYVLSKMQ